MHHGRKRLASALTGLALAAVIGVVPSTTSADAAPDVKTVQQQVDTLFEQAEQASERVNDAKIQLADLEGDLDTLKADQARQSTRLGGVQQQVQDSIVSQYQGQGLSAVGQVVVSDDPTRFVAGLSTMSAYNQVQSDLFASYATELKALNIRRQATAERTAEVDKTRAALETEKKSIDGKLSEAEALLDKLKTDERNAILFRGSVAVPSEVPASGRAAIAINYALAQVGHAYVYGAAGPGAFDCSGLMMRAWGAAGVGLPHSSSAQFGTGPHIATADLRPGDLVFYYSPISHVAMYIGNGLIVEAANPGAGVRVSGVFSMPYAGAVRPG